MKKMKLHENTRIMLTSIFQLVLILTIFFLSSVFGSKESKIEKCSKKPILNLITPKSSLDFEKVIYNKSNGEIFSPKKTNLKLQCVSSQPIDFDFEGYLVNKLLSVETSRNFVDEDECFSIVVEFETNREATGIYKCWNIGDKPTARASVYLYANGGTPPYLLHGDIDGIIEVNVKQDAKHAIIPCVTTTPQIPVVLYKIEREGFKLLPIGPHLSYDSKVGFKMDLLSRTQEPFVKYKCHAKNSSHSTSNFDVIVQLTEGKESMEKSNLQEKEIKLVTHNLTKSLSTFVCSGPVGSTFVSSSNCQTPIQCRLTERCMKEETTCGHFSCGCHRSGNQCSKSIRSKYDEGCSTLNKNTNGGVLKCQVGKEAEVSANYFIGLNGATVWNWRDTPESDVLKVSEELPATFYYVGEKIRFECFGAQFLFSRGFQWKLQLKNGTLIAANVSEIQSEKTDFFIKEKVKVSLSHAKIEKVVCMAPIWNETTWVKIGTKITLKDTSPPIFLDPTNQTLYTYANDKNTSIECEAKGYPAPDILWLRNGEEFWGNFYFDGSEANITKSGLKLAEIAESDHDAVYTCNASNPRGMTLKTYTIYVRAHPSKLIFTLVGVGLFVCFGIVLFASILVLKRMQKKKSLYVFNFSDFDMDEFKNGNPEAVKKCSDACERALYLPYDDTIFEIDEKDLSIEYDSILGQGEFGVVLKGKVTKNGRTFTVAVKTLKTSEISNLKAILSELKIMIFIGHHKNVIKLVGAVTRKVYVVVEYCALGNLETYLKQHRATFLDEFDPSANSSTMASSYVRIDYLLKTKDLIKWAYEVATGMEFLASKNIIHGDLALRNLLLNAELEVKITDFGLSKQMYKHSSNYVVKKRDLPLPWRWLAIETLKDYDFSTPSDVWSFGIVLWELFSLAEIPYPGCTFNAEFLRLLGNGHRLDKPRYSNSEIYSIMRECWRTEPSQRPTFNTLRHSLGKMLPPGSIDIELEILSQNDLNQCKEDFQLVTGIQRHSYLV